MWLAGCVCVRECIHVYFAARSVCAAHGLEGIRRNTTKQGRTACGLLCRQASLMLLSVSSSALPSPTGSSVWTSRTTLFAKSLQWMAPEVEARWKLGHMTASRKAR